MLPTTTNDRSRGFSLVEVLVAIALLGAVAAIAAPSVAEITWDAEESTLKKNAQTIASVYAAGTAAGIKKFGYFPDGKGGWIARLAEPGVIQAVIDGATAETNDVFSGEWFGVPRLDRNAEISNTTGAAKYLEWDRDNRALLYIGD